MAKDELAAAEQKWKKRSLFRERRRHAWRSPVWIALVLGVAALAFYLWVQSDGDMIAQWGGHNDSGETTELR